jgi:hypothetical protein
MVLKCTNYITSFMQQKKQFGYFDSKLLDRSIVWVLHKHATWSLRFEVLR